MAESLTEPASEVEIERLKEPIGKQDQYIAACGGLQLITRDRCLNAFGELLRQEWESKRSLESNLRVGRKCPSGSTWKDPRGYSLADSLEVHCLKRIQVLLLPIGALFRIFQNGVVALADTNLLDIFETGHLQAGTEQLWRVKKHVAEIAHLPVQNEGFRISG